MIIFRENGQVKFMLLKKENILSVQNQMMEVDYGLMKNKLLIIGDFMELEKRKEPLN